MGSNSARARASDSASVADLARGDARGAAKNGINSGRVLSPKVLVFVFLLFLFVSSDLFIQSAVALFPDAAVGQSPTTYGTVIQGIAFVIMYILLITFSQSGVI